VNLSQIIGIPLDDFIVFGDDIGDIEMIEKSGEGVLMSNSNVFEKYPKIIKTEFSNDEDGVCEYLDKKFKISAKPQYFQYKRPRII
jgi:hydroxymethylpyrimidine pyrophosphatase-like HAD family hydrolase